jgi:hypothetical protein
MRPHYKIGDKCVFVPDQAWDPGPNMEQWTAFAAKAGSTCTVVAVIDREWWANERVPEYSIVMKNGSRLGCRQNELRRADMK